jgi:hypothetical protein
MDFYGVGGISEFFDKLSRVSKTLILILPKYLTPSPTFIFLNPFDQAHACTML